MKRLAVSFLALTAILTGCTAQPPQPGMASPSAPTPTAAGERDPLDPAGLVGLWRVDGAEGESPDTWLVLGKELDLWRECGVAVGYWAARDDAVMVGIDDAALRCDRDASWLTDTTAYRYTGDDVELLNRAGTVLATLVDDDTRPDDDSSLFSEPVQVTDHVSAHIRTALALPPEASPAVDLVGRWLPVDSPGPSQPFIEFRDHGSWRSSDGCNRSDGRWVIGTEGAILASTGPSTAMACEGMMQVGGWVYEASAVGLVGDELRFYGDTGEVLGTLARG